MGLWWVLTVTHQCTDVACWYLSCFIITLLLFWSLRKIFLEKVEEVANGASHAPPALSPADCETLRWDGYRSPQYYSQGPCLAAQPSPLCDEYQDEDADTDQKVRLPSTAPGSGQDSRTRKDACEKLVKAEEVYALVRRKPSPADCLIFI